MTKALIPYNSKLTTLRQDPIGAVIAPFLEAGLSLGLQKFQQGLAERLGVGGVTPYDTLRLQHSELGLTKAKLQLAMQERKAAEAEERREMRKAKDEMAMEIAARQTRMFDLKIEEKEMEIEARRNRLEQLGGQRQVEYEHFRITEPIQGALDFRANPTGITGGTAEQQEDYKRWLDSLEMGKVILILGKRGSGKTAFGAKLAEYLFAAHQMPIFFIGMPEGTESHLPRWVKLADDPDNTDVGAFLLVDEAGIQYLATKFLSDKNTIMRKLLMIARHRRQSLAFIGQVAADLDKGIVRQADSVIFKEPNLMQNTNDRVEVRKVATQAIKLFKAMPKKERLRSAYVNDGEFMGMIQYDLPEFWSENLSFAWANVNLGEVRQLAEHAQSIDGEIDSEEEELGNAEVERQVLELRKGGLGYDKIAKALGISKTKVRRALGVL